MVSVMNIVKEMMKILLFLTVSFYGSAFVAGIIEAFFNIEVDGWFGLFVMAGMFTVLEIAFHGNYGKKYKTPERGSDEFNDYYELMCGSLVAMYNKTHDNSYDIEYRRRLMKLGFSNEEATNLFMFELMILKSDRKEFLTDPKYIYKPAFDYKTVPLPQKDSWYVEHQMFLLSELVKIWDEAEYTWTYSKDKLTDETIKNRVYSLTRYGGGNLVISYLEMMSEKSHTDIELLKTYAKAEQDMLYKYRWRVEAVENPYR